jgi:hypothetical protein
VAGSGRCSRRLRWAGVGEPLAAALAGGDREAVFDAVLEALANPFRPTVFVVEDAHWADEATLDVVRHVRRRVADLPAVVVITYRDDEISLDHPLRRVLGVLAGGATRRVVLGRLSRTAVARLTGETTITSAGLYRLTGGQPVLPEVLAAPQDTVPATVADAVLAPAPARASDPAGARAAVRRPVPH